MLSVPLSIHLHFAVVYTREIVPLFFGCSIQCAPFTDFTLNIFPSGARQPQDMKLQRASTYQNKRMSQACLIIPAVLQGVLQMHQGMNFPPGASGMPSGVPTGMYQPATYMPMPQQQQNEQLRLFWLQQNQEIQQVGTDPAEFKNHQLPLARIKKVGIIRTQL